MGLAIGMVGFLGFFVFLILLIVRAIKRESKKSAAFGILVCFVLFLAGAMMMPQSDQESDTSNNQTTPDQSTPTQYSTSTPDASSGSDMSKADSIEEVNSPGPCTLPSGFEIRLFYSTVRNDVTGNWRLSASSSSIPVSDCALEYYNDMFASDDEIHAVWNATLGTTTCIKVMSGLLFVDTYEYVDGEEHDAKLLFSGDLLTSEIIDLNTGEPWEG